MKSSTIIAMLLVLTFSGSQLLAQPSGTIIPAGTVSGTWTKAGSPYQIEGDIQLPSGQQLVIEPGVTVEFQGYYEFTVQGSLSAVGRQGDSIYFTISNPAAFYTDLNDPAGSWNGLSIQSASSVHINRCVFTYAKALGGAVATYWGGAIYLTGTVNDLVIRASRFSHNYAQNNGGAITVNTSSTNFIIDSCLFSNNTATHYGGAIFSQDGEFQVSDSEFSNNNGESGGAIGFWGGAEIELYRNIFYHNSGKYGGAIDAYYSTFTAVNNILTNNESSLSGGAIYTNHSSYPKIINNLIVNNSASSYGGGVYLNNTNAIIVNSTIAYNLSSSSGGGIYLTSSSPEIQNSILYNNSPSQLHIGSTLSIPNVYYSNIQGDSAGFTGTKFFGEYENNIDAIPKFNQLPGGAGSGHGGVSNDWSLMKSSASLNAGNPDLSELDLPELDVYKKTRIRNALVDQGAAETHIDAITAGSTINVDTYWLADTIRVTSNVNVVDPAILSINPGSVVLFEGYYKLDIDGTLIAKGTMTDTIVFTVPAANRALGWQGIYIDNSSGNMFDNDSSIIDHCRLEYSKDPSGSGGALESRYFSKLRVSHSHFRYDSADYKGGAIHVESCSPYIYRNLFEHNHANRGAVAASYGSPLIEGNIIRYNTHSESVGGIFGWWSNFIVRDNFIANNEGGFYAFASNTKTYQLINNIIVNNDGYSVGISGQDAILINNTIVNNDIGPSLSNARFTVLNNIFAGNGYSNINSGETVQIYNCLIEGGLAEIVSPSLPTLEQGNNLDASPAFANPTTARGMGHETEAEDWKILSVSPAIDKGASEFPGISLAAKDFFGNPRINMTAPDIGALENQTSEPVITAEPIGGIKCTGDSILLSIEVNDTVNYQWQKEGQNIPGANQSWYSIDSLVQVDEGNYRCVISNGYGTYSSGTVLLIVKEAPDLLLTPESQWVRKGDRVSLSAIAAGTRPIRYQWYLDGDTLQGATESEIIFPSIDYSHEGTYHCEISNVCGAVETDAATYYVAPEICMVTVDSITGDNLIVWEKQTSAALLQYNVYREGVIADLYDLIGTVPYDDLSVFVDTASDPTTQAYWYKITATDQEGRETDLDLCVPHKTIHLLTTRNPETGATQLDWDHYIGFNYGTFHILRSTSENFFSIFHSMASSTTTWSDLGGGDDTFYYRIAVQKTGDCNPSGNTKATTGPYTHALSNLDDNKLLQGTNPPDTIKLDNHSLQENNAIGAIVGRFSTEDRDSLDVFTYNLVTGEGDEDNASFTLAGDVLMAIVSFNYEVDSSYSIRIRTMDNSGNTLEQVFEIFVTNVVETGLVDTRMQQVMVYPNPFSESAIIHFPNPAMETFTLTILDLSGKIHRIERDITGTRHEINRAGLNRGYYHFILKGRETYRGRFIIK